MYELNRGTYRLAQALECVDKAKISKLAELLNYYPSQLEQDIQALNDWISEHKEQEKV